MGFRLAMSRVYLPPSIRQSKLDELLLAAAGAFQCQVPQWKGLSSNQYLTKFALFTAEKAEEALRQGNECAVKERLYSNAYRIGNNIREELRVRTLKEVMQACQVVYRALKIEFHGDSQGQIYIPECFFSSFYSDGVCRIISGLDEGLIAGLSGGLRLEFTQRITEGSKCCCAYLLMQGSVL